MIIEAFKIVSSVFPFIKEAFLWRDGAEADKPVTPADLRKRKAAVFILFASLVVNYLGLTKLYEMHTEQEAQKLELKTVKDRDTSLVSKVNTLEMAQASMVPAINCPSTRDIFDMVNHQVDAEISAGILMHVPPDKSPAKHR